MVQAGDARSRSWREPATPLQFQAKSNAGPLPLAPPLAPRRFGPGACLTNNIREEPTWAHVEDDGKVHQLTRRCSLPTRFDLVKFRLSNPDQSGQTLGGEPNLNPPSADRAANLFRKHGS